MLKNGKLLPYAAVHKLHQHPDPMTVTTRTPLLRVKVAAAGWLTAIKSVGLLVHPSPL